MKLSELFEEFASQAGDEGVPGLWSTLEVTRYANASERDAADRALLIHDENNGSAVVVTLTEGVAGITAEVQTITINAAAGTFTITYDGKTTAALAFNANAAAVQAALVALSNVLPGDVVVTLDAGVYTLTFDDALGDVNAVTVDDALLLNPIVDIPVLAGKAIYPLDTRIIMITHARFPSQRDRLPLAPASREILDKRIGAGWAHSVGTPDVYIDNGTNIRLVSIPSANDTLRLSVYRLPLVEMKHPKDEPEIPAPRHLELVHGMLARAYMKKDTETFNAVKAADHEAEFTRCFGQKIDANVRRKQRETRTHTTRVSW